MDIGAWIFGGFFAFIIGVIIVKRIKEYKDNKKDKQ
jgi:hypothetical protein